MQNAIDVRDMTTAVHSLFIVKHKPQTVCKAFLRLEKGVNDPFDEREDWQIIQENTENLGEVDYRDLHGNKVWIRGKLVSDVLYDDGDNKYKVIGSFDIWGI